MTVSGGSGAPRGMGCLSDPEDDRDALLGSLLGSTSPPARARVRSPLVEPRDQGGTNSCTGQAWTQALRMALLHRGVACPPLSALDNYWRSRREFGGEREDAGSYLRSGAKALMRWGCAAETAWPFELARVNRRPSWAADRSGHDFRLLRGYYRIPGGDVDGVRRAIATGAPVVGGWRVDRRFIEHSGTGVIDWITGDIIGSHAVVLEDYEPDGTFGLINSWGLFWGNKGRARVTEQFVAQGTDVWACAV